MDFSFYILQTYFLTYLLYIIFTSDFHLFYLSGIIYFNAFSEFLNFVYLIFKLYILLNYAEHPKELAPF